MAQNLLISTAGTTQTSPAFWLDPSNGVVYNLAVQSPQYAVDSLDALLRTPVRAPAPGRRAAIAQQSGRASIRRRRSRSRPVTMLAAAIDVYVSVQGRDLGSITSQDQEAGR